MMNIFAKHRAKIAAKAIKAIKATKATKADKAPARSQDSVSTTLQQLFTLVAGDVKRLKDTAREKRDALKMKLIAKYQPSFEDQCLEQSWTGNLFIFWNIIWRFDVGNFTEGWRLAQLGFERGLTADKQVFQRTFATIIADTIYEWAQAIYDNEQAPSPILQELVLMIEADDGLNINSTIHAKLLKLQGIIITTDNPQMALTYFEKATELMPRIGVKGRMEALKKELNK